MDYAKHYERLINRARQRVLDGFVEIHHVLPICMGGLDEDNNRVQLTPEEHYVAHQLLHRMYPKVRGLLYALVRMTGDHGGPRSNKLYGWIRAKVRLAQTENNLRRWAQLREAGTHLEIAQRIKATRIKNGSYNFSEQHRANIGKGGKGRQVSEETRRKLSLAHTGRPKSPEHIAKVAAANTGKKRGPLSDATKAKLSAALTGRVMSPETKAKIKATKQANRPAPDAPPKPKRPRAWKQLTDAHKAHIAAGLVKSYAQGRQRARSKLTDEQVREIRRLLAEPGITQKEIAERYGISQAALSELKSGKSYRHVL